MNIKTLGTVLKLLGPTVAGALGMYLLTAHPSIYQSICSGSLSWPLG